MRNLLQPQVVHFLILFIHLDYLSGFLLSCYPWKKRSLIPLYNALFAKKLHSNIGTPKIIHISDDDNYQIDHVLQSVVAILEKDGVGVIPTDVCYRFVTRIDSLAGIKKLLQLRSHNIFYTKKPFNLICKDYSMMTSYVSSIANEKWIYKLMKQNLPGPFTIFMLSNSNVPKISFETKDRSIGIQISNDIICKHLISMINVPLLSLSIPQSYEDIIGFVEDHEMNKFDEMMKNEEYLWNDFSQASWIKNIDFLIDNGPRGISLDRDDSITTIIDLISELPSILRQGKGIINLEEYF